MGVNSYMQLGVNLYAVFIIIIILSCRCCIHSYILSMQLDSSLMKIINYGNMLRCIASPIALALALALSLALALVLAL